MPYGSIRPRRDTDKKTTVNKRGVKEDDDGCVKLYDDHGLMMMRFNITKSQKEESTKNGVVSSFFLSV